MRKIRFAAVAIAVAMLMPMLMSCQAGKNKDNVVKADDPWYESSKFKIEKDLKPNADFVSSVLFAIDDRVFNLYSASTDRGATYRTLLDTYDYEGNRIGRQEVTCPELEDFRIGSIFTCSSDPEGKTLKTILYIHSASKHETVFADIDTSTGIVSNIKKVFTKELEKIRGNIFRFESAGEYTIAVLDKADAGIIDYQLMLFKNDEFVCVLDLSTVKIMYLLYGFYIDESADSLYMSCYEAADIVALEFSLKTGKLKNKKSFLDSDAKSVNFGEYTLTNNSEMCKIDSRGNIVKLNINSMTPETVIDTNWYSPYFYSLGNNKYSVTSTILSCTENKTVILDSESATYACYEYTNTDYIRVLKKADKNPHAGKQIIELALPLNDGITDYLARAIFEFNKSDNEYLIRVWDKYKTGFVIGRSAVATGDENEQQVYKMIQDLKGDDAPDLALDIQKNYAMRDEVFMDLTDFLEPEVMNKQFGNIIEAGRINGKLYFLPVTLEIEALVTKSDTLKDGAIGLTFEEYDKLVKDSMFGFSPYDYPNSEVYNKRAFILSCIDTKGSIDGNKIEFGTDQFRTAVQYAKEHFKYDDLNSTPQEYLMDWSRYRGKCYYARIGDYLDYVHDCYTSKDPYSIIGTPSVDASGPRFKAIETISVSATTDVKDGCKKFINYLFAGTAFASGDCDFRHIVTNREIMNKNIETLAERNNEVYKWFEAQVENGVFIPAAGLDKAYGDKYATDDMAEIFLNSLSTISTYYYEDYSIIKFLDEELAPYYAGDRSLDDAIKYVNDRTAKYVREM